MSEATVQERADVIEAERLDAIRAEALEQAEHEAEAADRAEHLAAEQERIGQARDAAVAEKVEADGELVAAIAALVTAANIQTLVAREAARHDRQAVAVGLDSTYPALRPDCKALGIPTTALLHTCAELHVRAEEYGPPTAPLPPGYRNMRQEEFDRHSFKTLASGPESEPVVPVKS